MTHPASPPDITPRSSSPAASRSATETRTPASSVPWHPAASAGVTLLGGIGAAWMAVSTVRANSAPPAWEAVLTLPTLVCATGAALVVALLHWRSTRAQPASMPVSGAPPSPLASVDTPLLTEVMPVWRTQLDSARSHADTSANSLLEAFGAIDGRLDEAIRITEQAQSEVGNLSVDDLVDQNQEALTQLLGPIRRAVAARDQVLAELETVSSEATSLREIANQVRQLAKRTSMVALNASVEASRAGERGSGFATVAAEVRQLAQQSSTAGASMQSMTARLETRLQGLRTQATIHDSSDEALQAEADASARAAISGLLRSVSEVSRSSRGLREAGQAVREQVERTLMGFQSQDRLNQMLGSIVDDIERMQQWLEQGGDLSKAQANAWLERLESSYTMEEQRTVHFGQSAIERSSSVDFF